MISNEARRLWRIDSRHHSTMHPSDIGFRVECLCARIAQVRMISVVAIVVANVGDPRLAMGAVAVWSVFAAGEAGQVLEVSRLCLTEYP